MAALLFASIVSLALFAPGNLERRLLVAVFAVSLVLLASEIVQGYSIKWLALNLNRRVAVLENSKSSLNNPEQARPPRQQ